MPDQQHNKAAEKIGNGLAEQLNFLADLGNRLAAAREPLTVIEAALPEILAQLNVESGRLLVKRPGAAAADSMTTFQWPRTEGAAPATSGSDERRARSEDRERSIDRPIAVIETSSQPEIEGGDAQAAAFVQAVTGLTNLALANAALAESLAEQHRVGDSLEMAADLQQNLQPACAPGHLPIWGVNLPARKVSGDFFDFYRLDETRIAFALGDVSGKGMNAALLMAKTISLFRCLGKRIDQPARLLEAINAELCETATRGMFVTMVAGHYWTTNGKVCFANAGHQPPLLRGRDRSYTSFPATAPPLGILPSTSPREERIKLDGGELYVFTDGLTEYRYVSGEELGVDGLIQLIESLAEAPLARRLEALLETLDQDAGWQARDDLTVLAIDDSWVRSDAGVRTAETAAASLRGAP